jgi:N-methylhydantoinase B
MDAAEVRWDGIANSYIPPARLRVAPQLEFHRDTADEVDPITFEVLRHNLWHVNEEHGATIVKVSGSAIAAYAHDFNPSILTEDGEFVYFGPYLQFHAGMIDLNVKWTLEYRSESPGIRDGDMFLANDPWVATTHQSDTALICPVFVDGKLFCWVANMLHFADLGGSTPGSFCPDARSVYDEPLPTPPVRLVEGGRIRRDIEEEFLRRSRLSKIVALDLRATIAGNTVARERILGLVERYGPETVKAAMRRIVSDGEQIFLRRLRSCPDGVWRDTNYLEVARTGDRKTYKAVLTMTKSGDRLIFSDEGTDPQTGAINVTYAGWRGGILCPINAFFLHDALYAIGGALRHIELRPTPGTFTCATHPGATSNGGSIGVHLVMGLAQNTVARMFAAAKERRREFVAQGGCTQWPGVTMSGVDRHGEPFGGFLLDPMGGAIGAFSFRDGVDIGGLWFDSKGLMPNVEQNEYSMPILYLYRREVPDSGGAGEFRGGNGGAVCFVPHKTERISQATTACGCAVPTARGLMGGFPGATNEYVFIQGSDVRERFRHGEVPTDLDALSGTRRHLLPKETGIVQGPDDVYAFRWSAGAGYGDPLERDPEAVRRDVLNGAATVEGARASYGVVLDHATLALDGKATRQERGKIRRQRRRRGSLREKP